MLNIRLRETASNDVLDADLHPVLDRVYRARGIVAREQVDLNLKHLLYPRQLRNIDGAVKLLSEVLTAGEKLLIVGDFDADGATSSALAMLCLRDMGFHNVHFLVPNRFDYGYGLTPEIVQVAHDHDPAMIMTVDSGVACFAGVALARDLGMRVLVTDHHLPGENLPQADCILNPNLRDCDFPSKALAGVGVVFYLMSGLRAHLREIGWFSQQAIREPNLAQYLDIVALGTVADVVPLDANNRRLVNHGLNIIRSGRGRPGIRALLEVAGRNVSAIVASDLGFAAGPRLNAAGRLDDMSVGINCLLAETEQEAFALARQLDALNRDRRNIEQAMQQEALQALQGLTLTENSSDRPGLCLYQPGWHQGVIGILASRLKDRFHRPVIVFADAGESTGGEQTVAKTAEEEAAAAMIKGSARSIPGLHMRDVLDLVSRQVPDVLQRFGGHAMAAGLTIRKSDFATFDAEFNKALLAQLSPELLQQVHLSDGELAASDFNLEFAQCLRNGGPWGQHFPEPVFHGNFRVLGQRVVGERHLKWVLEPASQQQGAIAIDAIAFNVDDDKRQQEYTELRLLYRLDINEFRGRQSLQLMVEAFEPVPA